MRAMRNRILPTLMVVLLLTSVLASSGCLVEEEQNGKPEVPEDRKDRELSLWGNVDNWLNMSFEEVMELGTEDFTATFVNSVGTTFTSNYTGVSLQKIIDKAAPDADVDMVKLIASDGYEAFLFFSWIDETTFIAVKEDGEWNDLDDVGAFRLVDNDLPSVYWVRDITEINLYISQYLTFEGLTNQTRVVNTGWIDANADTEVTWKEGTKNRTYTGVRMLDILEAVDADDVYSNTVHLLDNDDKHTVIPLDEARDSGVIVVDSRGQYVYVQEVDGLVIKALKVVLVDAGIRVAGEVGDPRLYSHYLLKVEVSQIGQFVVYEGKSYSGPNMAMLVAESGPDPTTDAVKVTSGDGYFAVFPLDILTGAVLALEEDGEPLELGFGPYRVVHPDLPGNFHVGWVVDIEVFSSDAINASGLVNITDAISIGTVHNNADTNVTYNDGRRDRTYAAVTWDTVLDLMDWNTTATYINMWDSEDNLVSWDINELQGRMDSGICVDSRGNYVAVRGDTESHVPDLVRIEVG
jgi:DMSO/TMAO reductase YedYZ molybdopterin-dependent catalytic subunit